MLNEKSPLPMKTSLIERMTKTRHLSCKLRHK